MIRIIWVYILYELPLNMLKNSKRYFPLKNPEILFVNLTGDFSGGGDLNA